MNYSEYDYNFIRNKVLKTEISFSAVTASYLERIKNQDTLNAFLALNADKAIADAEAVDRKIAGGAAGKLAGMVLAVKDNIVMTDLRSTCGSKILPDFHSPYDATVVERLKNEDAVLIGKTNMDEFGMGSSNENSAFGPVLNPHDKGRIPGGSSGGSAAAVASGMVMAALGTDTGGSVRQPASHCGIIGLRPTYGRVSRYGLIAFASSLDQIGILTKSAEDCARILQVIAGADIHDATSSDEEVPDYPGCLKGDIRDLRIGLPQEYFQEGLAPEIHDRIHEIVQFMAENGAEIVPVTLPATEFGIATYYLICTAEASSNLARFDGVRYGFRADGSHDLKTMYEETRSEGFGEEVKRRIMLGTYVLSAGYYDAYYLKAQKVRTVIRRDFEQAFRSCDVIAGPTSPTTAFMLGEKSSDPLSMYLSDIYTVTAPLAGLPAISVPAGKDKNALPIGFQMTAPAFKEERLMQVAWWLEKNLPNRFNNVLTAVK